MHRRWLPLIPLLALAACGAGGSGGAATGATTAATASKPPARAAAGVRLARVGSFANPVYVTAPQQDRARLFVVEQAGRIRVLVRGRLQAAPFLDISDLVQSGGEQGLLSMAFAPDYARTHRFYVYYTDRSGLERVVEYRRSAASPNRALRGSARLVLRMADPEPNHNGGQLQFGPDGLLYIGTGDGGGGNDQHGSRGNAQDLASPLGKILRIDPRRSGRRAYRIPAGNPFARRRGVRHEVYSYGLRNPWRFSFDRLTGDLAVGDVGQDEIEEIDFARKGTAAGANYGWRPFEGRRRNFDEPAPRAVPPVYQYTHARGCSITGGYVVRDRSLTSLYGRYVYGDVCEGVVRSIRLRPGGSSGERSEGLSVAQLSSFGEDAAGHVYAASLGGAVYRLAAR